jgi:hypothetical protein
MLARALSLAVPRSLRLRDCPPTVKCMHASEVGLCAGMIAREECRASARLSADCRVKAPSKEQHQPRVSLRTGHMIYAWSQGS